MSSTVDKSAYVRKSTNLAPLNIPMKRTPDNSPQPLVRKTTQKASQVIKGGAE